MFWCYEAVLWRVFHLFQWGLTFWDGALFLFSFLVTFGCYHFSCKVLLFLIPSKPEMFSASIFQAEKKVIPEKQLPDTVCQDHKCKSFHELAAGSKMDLYLYKTVTDCYVYCFKVRKATTFFHWLCFFCSHGHNFHPSRHVKAVSFEWVTISWVPFNCCLLVKITTISFCHIDELPEETTEGEQKAASSLCESSSTFCLLILTLNSEEFVFMSLDDCMSASVLEKIHGGRTKRHILEKNKL